MDADRLGLRVRTGDNEYTTVGYVPKQEKLFVDRIHSGNVEFNAAFPGIHLADLEPVDDLIRLHVFVDRSSVEILANDDLVSFTKRIFPDGASQGVELFADGGEAKLISLGIYQLHPANAPTSASVQPGAGQSTPIS